MVICQFSPSDMRRIYRVDESKKEIVKAIKKAGASVLSLDPIGGGCPDILVGYRNKDTLMELKTGNGEVRASQRTWHHRWRGRPVVVVRTPEEALMAIGAIVERTLQQ